MSTKKKVVVAFDSATMRTLITQTLVFHGFDVTETSDGLETLEKVYTDSPDAVVMYYDLPVIAGFSLSRIIKNTARMRSTAVIICTTEENSVVSFWNENSQGDLLFILDGENTGELVGKILDLCPDDAESADSAPDSDAGSKNTGRKSKDAKKALVAKDELARTIINAYEKELFQLYIVQDAFNSTSKNMEISFLARQMIQQLRGVYNYDAMAVIVNDEELHEFIESERYITQADIEDFRTICHSDFAAVVPDRREYNWHDENVHGAVRINKSRAVGKLRSYEFFPKEEGGNKSITLHIASCSSETMNSRTSERLNFFARVYSQLFEKALLFRHLHTSEEKMYKAFSRFLPPKIIDGIVAGDDSAIATVGEKRQVAILIADIRKFTTISEVNQPETIVDFLNSYFTVMGSIIKKHGGTIDKFMGDAIMAMFGAPESYEDNGKRAAFAALEMLDALKTLDTSMLIMPPGISFNIGIGINYGQPIVGAIGSDEKKEYTVIGDDVNVASRLEGLTKIYGTPIIISESVKKDLDIHPSSGFLPLKYFTRHIDNVKVKGKSHAVGVYELAPLEDRYSEDFLSTYDKALSQYLIGNFNSAMEYFNGALRECPGNKCAAVMLDRCREFIKNRPEDWDGAVVLTTK